MSTREPNPLNQISQPAFDGLASESYSYAISDGVPEICADGLLTCETYQYAHDVGGSGISGERSCKTHPRATDET